VLKQYARHYETGEPMPDDLIEKIQKSQYFNQGFATTEYLAASFLDMDWHTRVAPDAEVDVLAFENESLNRIGLIPKSSRATAARISITSSPGLLGRLLRLRLGRSTRCRRVPGLQGDGDIFNPQVAKAFRDNILSRGGTEEPMSLYQRFRGKEPGSTRCSSGAD